MHKSDIIVIGCGPGGMEVASRALQQGLTVTVKALGQLEGT